MRRGRPTIPATLSAVSLLWLVACTSTPNRAPVEERGASSRSSPSVIIATPPAPAGALAGDLSKPLPGAENAGKPGYYTVKPGDTLIRLGLENGQNWRDLVRWNNLDNPNVIEVGQVLRVVPPGVDPSAAAARPVTTARVESRPLDSKAASTPVPTATPSPTPLPAPPLPAPAVSPASAPVTATPPPVSAIVVPSTPRDGDDDVNWAWPTSGSVMTAFDDAKVKGLVFAGKAGDPVLAAADGRVVYAGSGLRGYGNLIILKHNNTYLTAYAHNQALLVKEDQTVRRGQKIAEMGSTDAEGVQLHFEIRKQGKPIDPAKLLPSR